MSIFSASCHHLENPVAAEAHIGHMRAVIGRPDDAFGDSRIGPGPGVAEDLYRHERDVEKARPITPIPLFQWLQSCRPCASHGHAHRGEWWSHHKNRKPGLYWLEGLVGRIGSRYRCRHHDAVSLGEVPGPIGLILLSPQRLPLVK